MNYFNIANNNLKHQLKENGPYWAKNNLPYHFITDRDWYIHAVMLYT